MEKYLPPEFYEELAELERKLDEMSLGQDLSVLPNHPDYQINIFEEME